MLFASTGPVGNSVVYRPEAVPDLTAMRAFVDEALTIFQMVAAGTAHLIAPHEAAAPVAGTAAAVGMAPAGG